MQNCEFCAFSYTENSLNFQIKPWSPFPLPPQILTTPGSVRCYHYSSLLSPSRVAVSAKGAQTLEPYTPGDEPGQVTCVLTGNGLATLRSCFFILRMKCLNKHEDLQGRTQLIEFNYFSPCICSDKQYKWLAIVIM